MTVQPVLETRPSLATAFVETRQRTHLLVSGMDPAVAAVPAATCLSPPVWDLGHIAHFQEQWLLQRLAGSAPLREGDDDTYDPMAHPRPERPKLPLLDLPGVQAYLERVLQQVLLRLESDRPAAVREGQAAGASAPLEHHFLHWMAVLHEHQHQETLLQSFALQAEYRPAQTRPLPLPVPLPAPEQQPAASWCTIPAGSFVMGRAQQPGAYDNEAPAHEVHLPTFSIARHPATNAEYHEFVAAGGYEESRFWSKRGRAWLDEEPHHAPLHWRLQDGAWHRRLLRDGLRPVSEVPDEILCHVSFFEAEAYARYRDARLPTEQEWEKACRGTGPDPAAAPQDANVDHLGWGPSRVGAYRGRGPYGVAHMLGDVWEWCDTPFDAYPGFQAYPYPEYSQVFFGGDHKVLRGGSWATRPSCATPTFRNWDHPYRRQIFCGVRLARDGAAASVHL